MINVERHFAVVGVLEELDITIQVFEKFLPRYSIKVRIQSECLMSCPPHTPADTSVA